MKSIRTNTKNAAGNNNAAQQPFFWSSNLGGLPAFDLREATVHVDCHRCGCKSIHEHSRLAAKREIDNSECRGAKHNGTLPKVLYTEYYV